MRVRAAGAIALARTPSLVRLMADEPAYHRTVAQLEQFVTAADPVLGSGRRSPVVDREALRALLLPMEALATPVHDLTLAAAHRVAERADAGNRALGLEAPHHAGGPVRALPSDRHRRNG
jgi:hypothetical protein